MAACGPDLLTVKNGRPLCIDENVGQSLNVARIADRTCRGAVLAGLRNDGLGDVDLAVEYVARDFQVHRTRRAVEGLARRHSDHVRHAFRAGNCRSELGDGGHQLDVRQILQRAHLVLGRRTLTTDVQNRALRTEGGGDARDRIGAAGTGGCDHAAELARLARITVRRVRGHLFMANVDDANALIDAAVVDVDDVAAAQGEYRVHTLIFQCLGNQVPAGYHARVATLALQSIFGGR